jgi:hypothetical protein
MATKDVLDWWLDRLPEVGRVAAMTVKDEYGDTPCIVCTTRNYRATYLTAKRYLSVGSLVLLRPLSGALPPITQGFMLCPTFGGVTVGLSADGKEGGSPLCW